MSHQYEIEALEKELLNLKERIKEISLSLSVLRANQKQSSFSYNSSIVRGEVRKAFTKHNGLNKNVSHKKISSSKKRGKKLTKNFRTIKEIIEEDCDHDIESIKDMSKTSDYFKSVYKFLSENWNVNVIKLSINQKKWLTKIKATLNHEDDFMRKTI